MIFFGIRRPPWHQGYVLDSDLACIRISVQDSIIFNSKHNHTTSDADPGLKRLLTFLLRDWQSIRLLTMIRYELSEWEVLHQLWGKSDVTKL